MSAAVGAVDVTRLGAFAWKLYKACKEASEEFESISQEVVSLHIALKETEDCLYETRGLSPTRDDKLTDLIQGITGALLDLEKVLDEYEKLGTQAQRTWDRMHWGLENLADARQRIISNTTLLSAFNQGLSANSSVRIEKRLNKFVQEFRAGLRESSVMSDSSSLAESIDSVNVWKQLQEELEDIGISESVLKENQRFITEWLQRAIKNGMLEEENPDWRPPAPSFTGDSGYETSLRSYVPTVYEMTMANKEFARSIAESRTNSERSKASSQQPVKVRKASTVSTYVFKLMRKDTEIIEAASDGDIAKVAKLISRGANVNARDRWGWTALSMCGYGGFPDIARLLMEHGADLDNIDVDGDTPEILAMNRGHTEMVVLFDEERLKRAQKEAEANKEKPRPGRNDSVSESLRRSST